MCSGSQFQFPLPFIEGIVIIIIIVIYFHINFLFWKISGLQKSL